MLPKILWGKSYCSPTLQARAITLYWKLTQVHIPFEGVPGPKPRWSGSRAAPVGDRPSCPNRGLLPARGGAQKHAQLVRWGSKPEGAFGTMKLGRLGLAKDAGSHGPSSPLTLPRGHSIRWFDSRSHPRKMLSETKMKIQQHKMKKGTKQKIWRELKV